MPGNETIAAIATAPGRGGVAVVRISGPDAFRVAAAVCGRRVESAQAGRFFHSTFRDPACGSPLDDGLLLVFAAPRSYTGEDVVELQGHGGSVAPRRVLEACLAAGARLARRGEFTERAFLNGRLDLGAAEAVIDLVDAKTARAADDAVARLAGAASRPFERMYADAIDLSSRVEHALDFSEDELPPGFDAALAAGVDALSSRVEAKLSTAREGRILREGALVVLAGPPNAGKSSLLNALLGADRAIVSATAGTTRDAIEDWAEIGGWPVRLVDTAGLRATGDAVEAEGVARAEDLIARADLVLRLSPADAEPSAAGTAGDSPREIRVCSKCDLGAMSPSGARRVSARTGEGLDALRGDIANRLAKLAARRDEETGADVTTRQRACLLDAQGALARARSALDLPDLVLAANELRAAAEAIGRVLGKVYSDDLLDALFSRFCVGK
ncbi:MAG: tRNA uridine-5-carboxymethylaminomethyl(34) synthesis GTPase MnmE [Kiritimatiellae bacterium]|nr:tRNA uridine-5-carboxymethylaminomethyl(34) synthesis GTPase MnmE [Kiritimatiellia bacterium]